MALIAAEPAVDSTLDVRAARVLALVVAERHGEHGAVALLTPAANRLASQLSNEYTAALSDSPTSWLLALTALGETASMHAEIRLQPILSQARISLVERWAGTPAELDVRLAAHILLAAHALRSAGVMNPDDLQLSIGNWLTQVWATANPTHAQLQRDQTSQFGQLGDETHWALCTALLANFEREDLIRATLARGLAERLPDMFSNELPAQDAFIAISALLASGSQHGMPILRDILSPMLDTPAAAGDAPASGTAYWTALAGFAAEGSTLDSLTPMRTGRVQWQWPAGP